MEPGCGSIRRQGGSNLPEFVAGINLLDRLHQFTDYLQVLWNDYVVDLNFNRQREVIYEPLVASTSASIRDTLFNPEWWRLFWQNLRFRMGLDSLESFRSRWITWRTAVFAPVVILIGIGLLFVTRRIWRWCRARFHSLRGRRDVRHWRRHPQLEFYARWQQMLARYGMRRHRWQSHREFAELVTVNLSRRNPAAPLNDLPHLMVQHYYRVRFGGEMLKAAERTTLESASRQLEQTLRRA